MKVDELQALSEQCAEKSVYFQQTAQACLAAAIDLKQKYETVKAFRLRTGQEAGDD